MNSPLQLKEHRFTELSVQAIADGTPGNGVDVKTTCALAQNSADIHLWRVTMTLEFGSLEAAADCPYQGKAEIIGTFAVAGAWEKAGRAEELVAVNGASILYGAVREMVLLVTSRSSHGPLVLPTLSFTPQSREPAERVQAAEQAKPSQGAPLDKRPEGRRRVRLVRKREE